MNDKKYDHIGLFYDSCMSNKRQYNYYSFIDGEKNKNDNPPEKEGEKFGEISEAYSTLSNKIKRTEYDKENGFGPEFDHMAIIAQFNNDLFLTDVGFGEFTFHPLKIELNQIQQDKKGEFKIENYDDIHFQVSKKEKDNWNKCN